MKKLLLVTLLIASFNANAFCFKEAAERYNVSEALLLAIAKTESGMKSLATNTNNKNGTKDMGLMQINSVHLPALSHYGITEKTLYNDPCTNVQVGAWILAKSIAAHGNTWRAVGSYNTGVKGSEKNREIYVRRVIKNLNK